MLPATAWDERDSRVWSVMGHLRARQQHLRQEKRAAQQREQERSGRIEMMTAASGMAAWQDSIKARWHGGPSVLAFLFAQPDSEAMRLFDRRGDYFNSRTGDTWDLFFPGYYQSEKDRYFENETGAQPVGQGHTRDWYFNPRDFNLLRQHVEKASEGRWRYSGGTDLVLINGWMPEVGDPSVDWPSTISGCVTDDSTGTVSLALPEVIERVSRDIELVLEDPSYGVGTVVDPAESTGPDSDGKKVMISALGGIVAALGKHAAGI